LEIRRLNYHTSFIKKAPCGSKRAWQKYHMKYEKISKFRVTAPYAAGAVRGKMNRAAP
jgi:hypothetical protein